MEFIDISMKIEEGMPVYPGNPEPEIEMYREIPEDSTTESRICIGSHTGSHVDAPEHVMEDSKSVSEMELENFYGEAQVLDLTEEGREINREALEEKDIKEDIVLLKTENSEKRTKNFRENFAYLALSGVEHLIEEDVETVGIDYLSLVEFEGGEEAEKAHSKANMEMTVIEGLNLSGVEEKSYTFSGFPVNLETDGAPLRPVLISE
jgi:arylformamidase